MSIEERYECKRCGELLMDRGKAEKHFLSEHFDDMFEMFYNEADL